MWAMLIIALLSLLPAARLLRPGEWRPLSDISHLTLSASCLAHACNPYDAAALNREAAARHESRPHVWREAPIYPPSSLLVVLPFAHSRWPAGALAFDALSAIAFTAASLLLIWRLQLSAGPTLLILAVPCLCNPLSDTLAFGNPALLTIALITISCTLLLTASPRAYTLAWICLGLALALKPPLAAAALLVLLLRKASRSAAAKALALSLMFLIAACLAYRLRLGSFHFLADLRTNLHLSQLPGASSDFSPANDESFDFLNLQTILSRIPGISRAFAETLAWTTTFALAAAGSLIARRSRLFERMPWTVLALATLISILPIYHRGYDRVLAILLAPAAIELSRSSKPIAWLYAALVCFWVANDTLMSHVLRRWHFATQNATEELLLCALLLLSMLYTTRTAHTSKVDSIAL